MPTRAIATKIAEKLVQAGHIAYFAGGWVRDFLLKHPSDDIDIATSASPHEVQALFKKTVPVGISFGIVIVVEEGHNFEVATFRKDFSYIDGRRPSRVESASAEEDAQRRDFTINGMFYDPLSDKIFDFVEGQKDLQKGIIRAIGNPQDRFAEDRLRMMRAVRYSTRFNFPIESDTLQAILTHAHQLLPAVAIERVWQELKKMARFDHLDRGLVILHELNLLPTIFPVLRELPIDTIQTRVQYINQFPKNAPPIAQLTELFPGQNLPQLLELCDYLKLSRIERSFAEFFYHTRSLFNMPQKWQDKLEPIEWARFYANPFSECTIQICAAYLSKEEQATFLQQHIRHRQTLEQAILRIQANSPIVRAEHLIQHGIIPGKKMGDLLQEAERISVNYGLEDRESIIQQLKQLALWHT